MRFLRFGVIFGGTIFLIPGIMLAVWFFKDLSEAKITDWIDAAATIEEVRISDEKLTSPADSEYKHGYSVRHSYIISYETASGYVRVQGSQVNAGDTNLPEIPHKAYQFYSPGETVDICYNPTQPDQHKFGTKQDLAAGRLVEPVILMIFAAPGLIIVLVSLFRNKPGDKDIILPKRINTGKIYSIDEVMDTLSRETDLPEPYTYKGLAGGPAIYIPGNKGWDIQVLVRKSKLTITNAPRPEGVIERAAVETVIGPVYYHSNHELFDKVVSECNRLFA